MKQKNDVANIKKPAKKPKAKQRSEAYLKYQRYIRSKEFKEIKQIIEERDHRRCACCGWSPDDGDTDTKRTLTCHHRTYKHLYHELEHPEDLITICNVCHRAIHAAHSNIKRFKRPDKNE